MRTLQGLAADLLKELAKAEDLALRNPEAGGREGALAALTAVCEFVMNASARLPDPSARADMLGRKAVFDSLAIALIGLRHGTVAPILEKQASHNRALLPTGVMIARGYAAAATEILIRSGVKPEQAARTVASHIKGRPELAGVKREAWKAVQRWRSDIKTTETRPTWDVPGLDLIVGADVATFDEMMKCYDQLLAEGKSSVDHQRQFAVLMIDQGRQTLSRKGRA